MGLSEQRIVKISKYLSRHLRHQPDRLGLRLQPGGWVDVTELLQACRVAGVALTRGELDEVVARNDKRRFGYDPTGRRIRASQGHSVDVDLQLPPVDPPARLFHGTSQGVVATIRREGLSAMGRRQVHLSPDTATATTVGARRGLPVVLVVDTAAMAADGHRFYRADNDVWLVDAVPARYLST